MMQAIVVEVVVVVAAADILRARPSQRPKHSLVPAPEDQLRASAQASNLEGERGL